MQLDTMRGMSLEERNAALTTWLNDLTTVYARCAAQRTDLLAACEAAEAEMDACGATSTETLERLRAAIANARGEHV